MYTGGIRFIVVGTSFIVLGYEMDTYDPLPLHTENDSADVYFPGSLEESIHGLLVLF